MDEQEYIELIDHIGTLDRLIDGEDSLGAQELAQVLLPIREFLNSQIPVKAWDIDYDDSSADDDGCSDVE